MSNMPFYKFVVNFCFFNKDPAFVVEKLRSFGYHTTTEEVSSIIKDVKSALPENIIKHFESCPHLYVDNESHKQWLQHFGVLEIYDYILNKNLHSESRPEYFKWIEDCMWAHSHRDVMCLINILLFNREDLAIISDVVMFKYRRKIGVDALRLYQSIFWNTDGLDAKTAHYYCMPFRKNTLILRIIKSGTEVEMLDVELEDSNLEQSNGSDVPVTFHGSDYIKWKIGYNSGVKIPDATDFLKRVQMDSYYKYYEAMNMSRSVDTELEVGSGGEFGAYETTRRKKKNVEEARAKIAKEWFNMYLKATERMPTGDSDGDFFARMEEAITLDFCNDEKIVNIDDAHEIMNDIKGCM